MECYIHEVNAVVGLYERAMFRCWETSYISTRHPIGRYFSVLRRLSTRSTMGEQELAGVTLKSAHFRDALQLDTSHVTCGFMQKINCRNMDCNSIIFELSIVAGYTVSK